MHVCKLYKAIAASRLPRDRLDCIAPDERSRYKCNRTKEPNALKPGRQIEPLVLIGLLLDRLKKNSG